MLLLCALQRPGTDPAGAVSEEDFARLQEAVSEEAPPELLRFDLGDSDVSLFLKGSWKGSLAANWGMAHSEFGWQGASTDSPLLFTQEADLTLSLWLRERWFVEAGFLDDYDLNTYRAGYQGREGEAIQYLGVGNTGPDYPLFPYLDLGGNSAYSFGVYGRFGIGAWTLHSMFRHDSAARVERVFVGNRERTYSQVSPSQMLRGRSFVLPQENIAAATVYFEDQGGDLRDASGRRWRKALPGEYGISARYGLLELAAEPGGMVAVSYSGGYVLGSYQSGTGFLGEVQDYFDGARSAIQLWTYPQPGGGSGQPGTVSINGLVALVVYEKGAFSPFERQNRYAAPTGSSAEAILAAASTGAGIDGFEVLPMAESLNSASLPLLPVPETQRGVYELVKLGGPSDPRSEDSRWPLLNSPQASYPRLYLPGGGAFNQDLSLRFANYGPAGAYDIGTDVVPGSVEVFRGGLPDPNIAFNTSSGTVQLRDPVGASETIRIAYLKRSEETRLGSLAAGIGATYHSGGPFSSALGLGLRWNVAGESFSEAGALSPGTVGFGGRADWDYGRLKAGTTLGLGFEQADTTGLYRIAGMEGSSELALSLSPWSGFISREPASPPLPLAGRSDLVYRNYRNTDILGSSTLMPIDWSGSSVIAGNNGPYPVKDSVYQEVFVAEPDNLDGAVKTWAGFQVPLGSEGELLERARQIMVPFRFHGPLPKTGDVKVVVQFGSLLGEEGAGVENPNLMVEKTLLDFTAAPSADWTPAGLYLSDADRRKLQGAGFMRVLIISGGAPFSGRALVARPVVYGSSWRPISVSAGGGIATAPDSNSGAADGSVSLREATDSALGSKYRDIINRLHPQSARQQVLETQWNEMPSPDMAAGADGRAPAIPLENYRVLSFFVKGPRASVSADQAALDRSTLRFIIARGPDSLDIASQTALDLRIPAAAFAPGEWSRVEVRYGGAERGVSIDGWDGSGGALLSYRSGALRQSGDGQADQSSYMAAFLVPESAATLRGGGFSIDEITLEEPVASYRANAGGSLEWTAPGALVSIRDTPVLADLGFRTALETGLRGNPFIPEESPGGFAGMENRSTASVSVLGAQVEGDLRIALSRDDINRESRSSWSAGHAVSRGFGPLSFRESFSDSPLDRAMLHSFGINLSTPVFSSLDAKVRYGDEKLERQWNAAAGLRQGAALGLSLESSAVWTENSPETGEGLSNYGETWAQSWRPLIPDPGHNAGKRDASALFRSSLATKPLGADLSLEGRSAVTKAALQTQSETRGALEFPLALGNYRIRFREERYYRRNIREAGASIRDDLRQYGSSFEDSLPLWTAAPFYAFFDPAWGNNIARALEQSGEADLFDSGYYSDAFSVIVTFPENYGLASFCLPREAETGIKRGYERKLDTGLDMLTLNGSLGFSSLNIFGALGSAPLFRFYQTDEFRHTLIAAVNIPKNEYPRWRFQDEIRMDFFGFAGAVLSVSNTITAGVSGTAAGYGNSAGFLESLALGWTAPVEKSLLGLLYDWCCGKAQNAAGWPALSALARMEYERLRRETLELAIDASGSDGEIRVSAVIGHESLIRIFGRLTLSAFGKLSLAHDSAAEILSLIASIGTSLSVSF